MSDSQCAVKLVTLTSGANAATLASGANKDNDEGGGADDDDDEDNNNGRGGTMQPLMVKAAEYTRGRVEVTTAWIGWLSGYADLEGERVSAPLPPDQIESERARLVGGAVSR